jgi:hypothetical protein
MLRWEISMHGILLSIRVFAEKHGIATYRIDVVVMPVPHYRLWLGLAKQAHDSVKNA